MKSIQKSPDNFNMYLARAIEFDVMTTDADSFIYVKYLKFLQLCPIYLSVNKGWHTARIHHKRGTLKLKDHEVPDYILNRMRSGCNTLNTSKPRISDRQADIIDKRVHSNLDKLLDSPVGKASLAEYLAKK
ncbi:MAG: hypothetical protein H6981_14650 [Gammaproteobacteria bacterium]|nr:hypothetical protein [Gammaproteobacteria bacterium]